MEILELARRVDPELVREQLPRMFERGEGFRLTTGPIQRQDELTPEPLPERVRPWPPRARRPLLGAGRARGGWRSAPRRPAAAPQGERYRRGARARTRGRRAPDRATGRAPRRARSAPPVVLDHRPVPLEAATRTERVELLGLGSEPVSRRRPRWPRVRGRFEASRCTSGASRERSRGLLSHTASISWSAGTVLFTFRSRCARTSRCLGPPMAIGPSPSVAVSEPRS